MMNNRLRHRESLLRQLLNRWQPDDFVADGNDDDNDDDDSNEDSMGEISSERDGTKKMMKNLNIIQISHLTFECS